MQFQRSRIPLFAATLVAATLFGTPPLARASLIGDTVTCEYLFQVVGAVTCNPSSAVVGAGPEFTIVSTSELVDVDVQAASIVITRRNVSTFGPSLPQTILLESLDWFGDPSGEITGFSLDTFGVTNLDSSDISFDAHSVAINVASTGWTIIEDVRGFATITLETSHSASVPEPTTLMLLGLGLAGLGFARKRLH